MWAGGKFERRWSVTHKSTVDVDFGTVRVRRNGQSADSVGCFCRRGVWGGDSRIETVKDLDEVARTQRKADVLNVLPNDLCCVDTDDLAVAVQQRPAAVAGINGRICLDPCPAAGMRRSADCADNSFCYGKWHPLPRIADCHNSLTLTDGR